jgi:hypothetical protein
MGMMDNWSAITQNIGSFWSMTSDEDEFMENADKKNFEKGNIPPQ